MKEISIFSFLIFLMLFSCNTQKSAVATKKAEAVSNTTLLKEISKKLDYTHLKINGNLSGTFNEKEIPNLGIQLYNENDELLWINGSYAYISMIRGLATKDSIKAYEKINKTFIETNYSFINEILGLNFIELESLENVLLGKKFIEISDFTVAILNNHYVMQSENPLVVITNEKEIRYHWQMDYDSNFELAKVLIEDENKNQSLEIEYSDRVYHEKLNLPTKVKILVKDTKTHEFILDYTTFKLEKSENPYSVPDNFTKREIK